MKQHDPATAVRVHRPVWQERTAHLMGGAVSMEGSWYDALRADPDLAPAILRSLVQLRVTTGRRGERPTPEEGPVAMAQLRRLLGEDHTVLPFAQALAILVADRCWSLTDLAAALRAAGTPMSRSHLHRLLRGQRGPNAGEVAALAGVLGKSPEFFAEYRSALILAMLHRHFEVVPEASVALLGQVRAALAMAGQRP